MIFNDNSELKMKNIIYVFVTTMVVILSGCTDDFLTKINPNEPVGETYYKSSVELEQGLYGVYGKLQATGLYQNRYPVLTAARSDEGFGSPQHFRIPAINSTKDEIIWLWQANYSMIWRATSLIRNAQPVVMDETLKNQIIAEARFLRGWAYFLLVTNFENVVLANENPIAESDYRSPQVAPETIYEVIEADFQFAKEHLPLSYSAEKKGRVTKGTAISGLGITYLYQRKIDLALAEFEEVMDPKYGYGLAPNYFDNFTLAGANNQESVFEVQFSNELIGRFYWSGEGDDGANSGEANYWEQIVGPGLIHNGWHELWPTQVLLNEFEKGDPRYDQSFYKPGDTWPGANGPVLFTLKGQGIDTLRSYATRKYIRTQYDQVQPNGRAGNINRKIIRFADVILLYAETLMENGQFIDAIEQINRARARAGATFGDADFPILQAADYDTKEKVFQALQHERMVELNLEGNRFYDLVRWGLDEEKIKVIAPEYNNNIHRRLPIPQLELEANPNIEQNFGW